MTRKQYRRYEANVREFFEREGITHLSTGHPECPECGAEWDDRDQCPNGHGSRDLWNEPYCSSHGCDCCGSADQQNLEVAWGIDGNRLDNPACGPFEVCQDCSYYAAYGRLDDTTMDEMGL
jgi:hypothetical protein